jgi:hypothetical protein
MHEKGGISPRFQSMNINSSERPMLQVVVGVTRIETVPFEKLAKKT